MPARDEFVRKLYATDDYIIKNPSFHEGTFPNSLPDWPLEYSMILR